MREDPATPRRVLVADDHPLVRDGLARVVAAALPGVQMLEAATWPDCLRVLSESPVALAVVDLNMPGREGLDAVRELRARHAELALVLVSGDTAAATIRRALELGVRGFIPKSDPPDVIRHAVALVWAGGSYIPPAALPAISALNSERTGPATAAAASVEGDLSALTPRQTEVLRRLARGLPNKLIARELDLTEGTVKIHLAAIMRVLRVGNRTEAVVRAKALGFEP